MALELGETTSAVNVEAGTAGVQTESSTLGTVTDTRKILEIPLNGRHFVDLGLLIPGSVTPPQAGFLTAPLRGQGSFSFNTAGNREDTVGRPHNDLFVSLANAMDIPITTFGNARACNGAIAALRG